MDERRPDPDGLLGEMPKNRGGRGRLKIFFGYAAGVGKTYAMLDEAQELFHNGVDVVAGYIEPHTRPETMRLLEGLPILPTKEYVYRNITLKEFDLDAALRRAPAVILIDELAHTNVPGARNKKRYQDVEELLGAGIDVYTTINVQHIESLNDVVSDITKVIVAETVPDYIFDMADQVKIIDVETDDLLRRFEAGKVYRPERAAAAMQNFFTQENLRSLREIAVRKAAERISHVNQSGRQISERTVNSKLLVCVSHSPSSARCIRWAAQMAEAFIIPWVAVYVESRERDDLTEEQRQYKHANITLAERLGAEIITLSGADVAEVIAEYAKISGITSIVIGKNRQRRWFRTEFEDKLISLLPNIEIHVIPENAASDSSDLRHWRNIWMQLGWPDAMKSVLLFAAATGISFLLWILNIGDQNIIMCYILSVLAVSRITQGYVYGIVTAIVSVFAFNYFFVQPYYTFTAVGRGYPITFIIMLAVAVLTSTLTATVDRQARLAVKRERRTETLWEISRKLLATRSVKEIVDLIADYIMNIFGRSAIVYTNPQGDSTIAIAAAQDDNPEFMTSEKEKAVATWCFVNQKEAGAGTDTLMNAGAIYMPVVSQGKSLGVIGISCAKTQPSTNSRFFLQVIAWQMALALERQELADAQGALAASAQ